MCLYSLDRFPKISEKDIECYKLMYLKDSSKYVTPFIKMELPISKEKIIGHELKCKYGIIRILNTIFKIPIKTSLSNGVKIKLFIIDKGFIHTYINIEECLKFRNSIKDALIFKCIIPKGSKYYEDHIFHAYASNKIIFKEEV